MVPIIKFSDPPQGRTLKTVQSDKGSVSSDSPSPQPGAGAASWPSLHLRTDPWWQPCHFQNPPQESGCGLHHIPPWWSGSDGPLCQSESCEVWQGLRPPPQLCWPEIKYNSKRKLSFVWWEKPTRKECSSSLRMFEETGWRAGCRPAGRHEENNRKPWLYRLCNAGPVALVNSASGWQIDECLETNFLIKTKILISIKMK